MSSHEIPDGPPLRYGRDFTVAVEREDGTAATVANLPLEYQAMDEVEPHVGVTDDGYVSLYAADNYGEDPMQLCPDEADAVARELIDAADRARKDDAE